VNVTGSNLVSSSGTSISAGNDVNIVAASDKSDGTHVRNEVTSGFFSGGSFGMTIGKQSMDNKNRTVSSSAVASIQNRSDYKAESQSVGIGTGFDGSKLAMNGTGIGVGSASGSESSTTRSGISQADIKITDDAAQQAKTGKTAAQTIASINTDVSSDRDTSGKLNKTWNGQALQADVQAQAQITQAFGQQASKLIGDYAEEQEKKATDLRALANATTDPEVAKALRDQASNIESNWGPDGTMRLLAHTVVGGLTGGISGAAGAAAGTLTAPAVSAALKDAGIDAGLAKALTGLSSTLVGTAVGGVAGGAAAYNEVTNNYLKHEEDEQRLRKKAACSSSPDPSSCRLDVDRAYNQIGRTRQQRTCSDADSCRENKREVEEDLLATTARQSILDQKLYQGKLTDDEKAEYFSNGQQIQLMQAALQEANRQFRAIVPSSQWTLQERDAALADALTAIGGLGQAAAIGSGKTAPGTKSSVADAEKGTKTSATDPEPSTKPVPAAPEKVVAEKGPNVEEGNKPSPNYSVQGKGYGDARYVGSDGKEIPVGLPSAGRDQVARNPVRTQLPNTNTLVLTEKEARALGGENRGLIYVVESPRGKQDAQDFQAGTSGAFSDLNTKKMAVPALRYDNPNERGVNFIKFDGVETAKDGSMLLLLDAKIKLPLWSDSTKREILNTMQRVKTAIEQNPGYKVVYEFPNAKVERQAAEFIRESLFDDIVTTRVRKP
jgi:hypothetical protein